MKYRTVQRKNGIVYMISIPESATDDQMTIADEIILELLDEIGKLKAHNSEYKQCISYKEKLLFMKTSG